MSDAKPTTPWDFLEKPRHVVYLEKVSQVLWKYQLARPEIDMPDAAAIWDYLLERKLIGTEIVSVPSEDSPFNDVVKYFVTNEGRRLIDAYRKVDPNAPKSKFRPRWR